MSIIDFRAQIKKLMERKKISTAKLSRIVDLHPDTIYRYLRGESEITAANLEAIISTLESIEDSKP